jgi:hypothetical protein
MAADSSYSSVSRPLHIPGIPFGTFFLQALSNFILLGRLLGFIFTHGGSGWFKNGLKKLPIFMFQF